MSPGTSGRIPQRTWFTFFTFLLVVGVGSSLRLGSVFAYRSFQSAIPNGASVSRNGQSWPAVGHTTQDNAESALNPFGVAFKAAGKQWTVALCNADSDGDGVTNGAELGDDDCAVAAAGSSAGVSPRRATDISHPGFADSVPAYFSATPVPPPTVVAVSTAFSTPGAVCPNVTSEDGGGAGATFSVFGDSRTVHTNGCPAHPIYYTALRATAASFVLPHQQQLFELSTPVYSVPRRPVLAPAGFLLNVSCFDGVVGFAVSGGFIFGPRIGISHPANDDAVVNNNGCPVLPPGGVGSDHALAVLAGGDKMDPCGGHASTDVASGLYHYHMAPQCGVNADASSASSQHSPLLGYMLDGVPIYGPRGDAAHHEGAAPDDLDECGGHSSDGGNNGNYHYHFRPVLASNELPDPQPPLSSSPSSSLYQPSSVLCLRGCIFDAVRHAGLSGGAVPYARYENCVGHADAVPQPEAEAPPEAVSMLAPTTQPTPPANATNEPDQESDDDDSNNDNNNKTFTIPPRHGFVARLRIGAATSGTGSGSDDDSLILGELMLNFPYLQSTIYGLQQDLRRRLDATYVDVVALASGSIVATVAIADRDDAKAVEAQRRFVLLAENATAAAAEWLFLTLAVYKSAGGQSPGLSVSDMAVVESNTTMGIPTPPPQPQATEQPTSDQTNAPDNNSSSPQPTTPAPAHEREQAAASDDSIDTALLAGGVAILVVVVIVAVIFCVARVFSQRKRRHAHKKHDWQRSERRRQRRELRRAVAAARREGSGDDSSGYEDEDEEFDAVVAAATAPPPSQQQHQPHDVKDFTPPASLSCSQQMQQDNKVDDDRCAVAVPPAAEEGEIRLVQDEQQRRREQERAAKGEEEERKVASPSSTPHARLKRKALPTQQQQVQQEVQRAAETQRELEQQPGGDGGGVATTIPPPPQLPSPYNGPTSPSGAPQAEEASQPPREVLESSVGMPGLNASIKESETPAKGAVEISKDEGEEGHERIEDEDEDGAKIEEDEERDVV